MIVPSSAPVNIVETGTATSPARNAPRMPVSIGISSVITSITRSSRRRPEAAQPGGDHADPARRARRRSASPRRRTAVRSPRPCVDVAGDEVRRGVEAGCVVIAASHPLVVVAAALARAVAPQRAVRARRRWGG